MPAKSELSRIGGCGDAKMRGKRSVSSCPLQLSHAYSYSSFSGSTPTPELAMLVLPVGGARLDRSTRLEPRDSQRFQLFYGLLIGWNQPLQISLDAESLSLSSGADFSFELWV